MGVQRDGRYEVERQYNSALNVEESVLVFIPSHPYVRQRAEYVSTFKDFETADAVADAMNHFLEIV